MLLLGLDAVLLLHYCSHSATLEYAQR